MTGLLKNATRRLLGRSNGKHVLVTVSNWGYRITNAAVQVLGLRLLIGTLGQERYGVIAILAGLLPVFAIFDLGLGNSIQNIISRQRAENRDYRGKVSLLLKVLLALNLVLIGFVWALSPLVSPVLLKEASFLTGPASWILLGLAGSFFVQQVTFLAVVKIYYAEQRGHVANLVLSGASLLSLAAMGVLAAIANTSLPLALCALYLPTTTALMVLASTIALRTRSTGPAALSADELRPLFGKSLRFWLLGLGAALTTRLEFVVLSQVCGLREIVAYKVLSNVCMFIFMFYAAAQQAIWPTCAENAARNQFRNSDTLARGLIRRALMFTGVCVTGLILGRNVVLGFLSPNEHLELSMLTIALYGGYVALRVWCDTYAMLLMSADRFRLLIMLSLPAGAVGLTAQFLLGRYWGMNGVIMGLAIPFLLFYALPLPARWQRLVADRRDPVISTPAISPSHAT